MGKIVVLTKVRIHTCLHFRCNVSIVEYIGSVRIVNYAVKLSGILGKVSFITINFLPYFFNPYKCFAEI